MKGRNAEKLRAFGQSTPRATKKIESGPLKNIYIVYVFSSSILEREMQKFPHQFQVQHSTKQRNFYYYTHTIND